MPSSNPHIIPIVLNEVINQEPNSILDIGIGFGKYGYLCREYTDIRLAFNDSSRYHKWQTRIDGIEIFANYITAIQRNVYSNIYIGDALDIFQELENYDLILIIGMLEHLTRPKGGKLLNLAMQKAEVLIIAVPRVFAKQGEIVGNPHERHLSEWTAKDFDRATVQQAGRSLVAIYRKQ